MSTLIRTRLAFGLAAVLAASGLVGVPAQAGTTSEPPAAQQIFHKGDGGYDCFRIPAVVAAKYPDSGVLKDELVMFAEGRRNATDPCSDHGDIDLVSRRSVDGGRTWLPMQVVIKGYGEVKGNPTPIAIPGTATIVLLSVRECGWPSSCGRTPRATYSYDGGLTWPTSPAPNDLKDDLGFATAPYWLAFGPGHGIRLSTGRLLAGINYQLTSSSLPFGGVVYSDDDGASWHLGATEQASGSYSPQELSAAELPDGRIYLAARNQANSGNLCNNDGHDNRSIAILNPGGQTFYRHFGPEGDLVAPLTMGPVLRVGGQLLYVGPATCGEREDLRVRTSFNNGCSWQTQSGQGAQLWSGDAAYSDVVSLGGGKVLVVAEAGPDGSPGDANRTISWFTHTLIAAPAGVGTKTTPDGTGYGGDACPENGAVAATGRFGGGLSLSGGAYVKVPYADSPYAVTDAAKGGPFTWTGWFRYQQSSATQALLWAYNTGAGTPQVWLRVEQNAAGKPVIRGHVESVSHAVDVFSTDPLGGGTLGANVWHQYALTRDTADRLSLYLDGVRVAYADGVTGWLSTDASNKDLFRIHLGRRLDGAYPFTGVLDDVRFYDRALTQAELTALAAATSADYTPADLRLHLRFDTLA
ncbi:hypothetical protein Cs7R123_16100 [Catellatospora sp. TT07R-123]|uniref:sialidase family protein n=1 Tax=Catellatospora sp. TT07R-123 TaxID=2733863 RepID=UPI001B025105|nr:sialidase family protein [Catellatospora sp. TT07R-123]GHJ44268.1 hypothetical protein Cs7R123_16100 [Catellatospora sp. TT07R-123]